jgi:hypothetical protein
MALSSTSLGSAVRGGYRTAMSSNHITHLSMIRSYLKTLVYLLMVIFALLQYINWENSTTIVHHDTNMKSTIIKQSQQQRQQKQQQLQKVEQQQLEQLPPPPQQPPGITTKIHIVFSTGCNAFQDCKSTSILL